MAEETKGKDKKQQQKDASELKEREIGQREGETWRKSEQVDG